MSEWGGSEPDKGFQMLDKVLMDIDDDNSDIPCIECAHNSGTDPPPFIPLCWYGYEDRVHSDPPLLCNHCNYPLPKEEDFVMCENQRHTLCLYCLELKLFRIELGRFVAVMF